MKIIKSVGFGLLLALFFAPPIWAHGGGHGGGFGGHHGGGGHWGGHHGGFGGYWGGGYGGGFYGYPSYGFGLGWGSPYYFPSYRSYAPVITVPRAPTYYIERDPGPMIAPTPMTNYWYYCSNPQGYYPDVRTCSTDWIKVPPRPN